MFKMQKCSVGIFILLLSVFSFAQDKTKVACVGNSITYGSGISDRENDSYPAQLQKLLGNDYHVENFGNSGRTMLKNGDHPLWIEQEFKSAIEMVPDIVIILLGTNDSKPQNWKFKEEFVPDYIAMIDTFRAINPDAQIYACLPPPAFSVQWGIRDSVITTDIIPMIRQIVDSTNVDAIDFYTPFVDKNHLFPDDIHPNAEGAWEMAKVVYTKLTGKKVMTIQDVNVAYKKSVTVQGNVSDTESLVDGNLMTVWQGTGDEIIVSLDDTETIDMFATIFTDDMALQVPKYLIYTSVDSADWQLVVDQSGRSDSSGAAIDHIDQTDAQFVKLVLTGAANKTSDTYSIADFRIYRAAQIHAPLLYFGNIDFRKIYTRYWVYALPTFHKGYMTLLNSNDLKDPFSAAKGYRPVSILEKRSTLRPDYVHRYVSKAYYDGVEVISSDTLTVDWSITRVEDNASDTPEQYGLAQNYPNPFNSSTRISFHLKEAAVIKLNVFDGTGRSVRILRNEIMRAGRHNVVWNGKNKRGMDVASGVYFYRLAANNSFFDVKKCFCCANEKINFYPVVA